MAEIRSYNPEEYELNTSGVAKVRNENFKRRKYKLTKEGKKFVGKIVVVTLAGVAVITSFKISKDKNKPVVIPDYMSVYDVDYEVGMNDTWNKIAKKYYDEEKQFETFNQFKNSIKEANPGGLRSGHKIKVPNATEDPLLDRLNQLNYMVDTYDEVYEEYNVEYGETLTNLAERIVANESQVSECMSMIKSVNGLGKFLPMGKILVPKKSYFELVELRDYVKSQLDKSLSLEDEKSNGKH